MIRRALLLVALGAVLAGCQERRDASTRHLAPVPPATVALMTSKSMVAGAPILMRAFKKESELEVWMRGNDGRYAHLKTYPICRWSGQLGPKTREGDRQAPEGFYAVTPAAMNPNSSLYLSFDLGYPNELDRAHGRTGSHLMVHGSCSSRGCFALTDEAISEVYAIARESFAGGQRSIQFQSFPFRMTPENMAKHRDDPHIAFWRNLKEGADLFEVTQEEARVAVCNGRYAFGPRIGGPCGGEAPETFSLALSRRRAADEARVADLVSKGTPSIRLVYDDGDQHRAFRASTGGEGASSFAILGDGPRRDLGEVSRPEALARPPREILLSPRRPSSAGPTPSAAASTVGEARAR